MKAQGCLLIQLQQGWRLAVAGAAGGVIDDVAPVDAAALAGEVADFLEQHGHGSRRVIIGVHSQRVMAAEFEPPQRVRRNSTTLSYEMERLLPLAVEDAVADFVGGSRVFGAALVAADWLPIVRELETLGIQVRSITPLAALALQSLSGQTPLSRFDAVLWESGGWCELVQLRDGCITGWQHLPATGAAIGRQLQLQSIESGKRRLVGTVGVSPQIQQAIYDLDEADAEPIETQSMLDHSMEFAGAVLARKQSPWIELRRGALAAVDPYRSLRGGMTAVLLAAALLLITLCAVNWVRVAQLRDASEELRSQQAAAFGEAFPGSPVPAAIVARMESEHTKLLGAHAAEDQIQLPTPALNVLAPFLRGIPEDQRASFYRVRIENGSLDTEVDLASHAAADRLAGSLREEGFEVDPPTTTQNSDSTVTARLYATIRTPETGIGGDE